jgi:hypothetical protein
VQAEGAAFIKVKLAGFAVHIVYLLDILEGEVFAIRLWGGVYSDNTEGSCVRAGWIGFPRKASTNSKPVDSDSVCTI